MSTERFETPIALFVFSRPDTTRRVFAAIANIRPTRLLLIADGPRVERVGEKDACREVREIVSCVNWPCEVSTNYSDQNLGCQQRMISGLDWVFGLVEEAIVLEDDCLPDASFFPFCRDLLSKYRDDCRIWMISGFNMVENSSNTEFSYYFSNLIHCWGWATWRRAWSQFDEKILNWPEIREAGLLGEIFERRKNLNYWTNIFDRTYTGGALDAWDYQWFYAMTINHAMSIVPRLSLIENIGFGSGGTHTVYEYDQPRVRAGSIELPLVHPPAMIPLRSVDRIDQEISGFQNQNLAKRIWLKFRRQAYKVSRYRSVRVAERKQAASKSSFS
jgi:hypothetical protein